MEAEDTIPTATLLYSLEKANICTDFSGRNKAEGAVEKIKCVVYLEWPIHTNKKVTAISKIYVDPAWSMACKSSPTLQTAFCRWQNSELEQKEGIQGGLLAGKGAETRKTWALEYMRILRTCCPYSALVKSQERKKKKTAFQQGCQSHRNINHSRLLNGKQVSALDISPLQDGEAF